MLTSFPYDRFLVISLLIAGTGIYFVYSGLERMMYPVPVRSMPVYLAVISGTVFVKLFMGFMFRAFDKKAKYASATLKHDCLKKITEI